jgi:hypothetical protein
MELLTSIIDLESIQIKNVPFPPEQKAVEIEALANAAVDLGGLINIPVVQQVSIDEYELISGHLEYYAYCKAREIDVRLPDRMVVFVANKKNQAAIHQQLEILQAIETSQANAVHSNHNHQPSQNLQVKNLESSLKQTHQNLSASITQIKEDLLQAIAANSPQPIQPLDLFNRILETEIAFQVQRRMEEFLGATKAKKAISLLREISQNQGFQPFRGFSEILELLKDRQKNRSIRIISNEKMLAIVDSFQSHAPLEAIANQPKRSRASFQAESETVLAQMQIEIINAIETNFPKAIHPLEAFNRILEPEIAAHVQRKLEFLGLKKAEKIVKQLQVNSQRKNHRALQSFADILKSLEVKQGEKTSRLISEEKMIAILDRWSY